MKRNLKRILICFVFTLFGLIFIDLHILRGYFLFPIIYRDTPENFSGNINYSVTDNNDGTFDFSIKNEDFAYYPITLYRDEPFFDLSDSVLFPYALRYKISGNGIDLFDTGSGFDCGTGLSYALIRPYESFELKGRTLQELFSHDNFSYVEDSIKRWNISNDSIKNLQWQFYLPILSFGEEDARIYSNKILARSLLLNN